MVLLLKELTEFITLNNFKSLYETWRNLAITLLSSAVLLIKDDDFATTSSMWKMIKTEDRAAFLAYYEIGKASHVMLVNVLRKGGNEFNVRLFNSAYEQASALGHPAYLFINEAQKDKKGKDIFTALTLNMEASTTTPQVLLMTDERNDISKLESSALNSSLNDIRFLPFVDLASLSISDLTKSEFFQFRDKKGRTIDEVFEKLYPKEKQVVSKIDVPSYMFQKRQQAGTCTVSSLWAYLRTDPWKFWVEIMLKMKFVARLVEVLDPVVRLKQQEQETLVELSRKKEDAYRRYGELKAVSTTSRSYLEELSNEVRISEIMIKDLMSKHGISSTVEPFLPALSYFKALANGTIHDIFEWIMHVAGFDKSLAINLWRAFKYEFSKLNDFESFYDCDFEELEKRFSECPALNIHFINKAPEPRIDFNFEGFEFEDEENEEEDELKEDGRRYKKYEHSVKQKILLFEIEKECVEKEFAGKDYSFKCFPLLIDSIHVFKHNDIDLADINKKIDAKWHKNGKNSQPCTLSLFIKNLDSHLDSIPVTMKANIFYYKNAAELAKECKVDTVIDDDKILDRCSKVDYLKFKEKNAKLALYCLDLSKRIVAQTT